MAPRSPSNLERHRRRPVMRNLIIPAAAAIILAAGTTSGLADTGGSSNTFEQCANILANRDGYPASMVAYCSGQQTSTMTRHRRGVHAAPAMRDDGPSITLPG